MRPYEIVIIFDADTAEATVRGLVDRATGILSGGDGDVARTEHWGKRRFAFELRHRWEGYYVLLAAKVGPAQVEELDRMLSLADEVLRHRIVRIPENVYRKSAPEPTPAEA